MAGAQIFLQSRSAAGRAVTQSSLEPGRKRRVPAVAGRNGLLAWRVRHRAAVCAQRTIAVLICARLSFCVREDEAVDELATKRPRHQQQHLPISLWKLVSQLRTRGEVYPPPQMVRIRRRAPDGLDLSPQAAATLAR